jgi:hypothetical protein
MSRPPGWSALDATVRGGRCRRGERASKGPRRRHRFLLTSFMFYPHKNCIPNVEDGLPPIVATMRGLDLRGRGVVGSRSTRKGQCSGRIASSSAARRQATAARPATRRRLCNAFSATGPKIRIGCFANAAGSPRRSPRGTSRWPRFMGFFVLTNELDDGQLKQLALVAPFINANFNPEEPRDAHGRWTTEGGEADIEEAATRSERKSLCIERCYQILERPRPWRGSDINYWAFQRCVAECMAEAD